MAPWADYLYFCDSKWWLWHRDRDDYQSFAGQKITQDKAVKEPGVWRVDGKAKKGISDSPDVIHFGQNSGFQVLNLAVHFGAIRILLLGYDMKIAPNGAAHWFGDHPDKVRSNYPSWLTGFSQAADQLRGKVEVINCSPDTALRCFDRMSLASALSLEPVQA